MVVLASFAWQSIRGRFGVGHLKMGSYATWSLPSGVHLEDKNINVKLFKTWVTCNCILNGRSKAYILVVLMFHYSAYQGAWLCLLIVYEGNECCYPTMAWVAEKGWRCW